MANNNIHKYTKEERCTLYRAVNGTPEINLVKVIDLMGGIENIIRLDDTVVIKPNLQWWNQGAPNLAALKTFIELIMERPGGFTGEVIVAENCHRGPHPWKSSISGWAHHFTTNSDIPNVNNLNELSRLLKRKYHNKFSICHWIDVKNGGKRVYGPPDGTGYIYCDGTNGVPLIKCDNGAKDQSYRATIMSYPIFSSDKGTVFDFKNGIWEKDTYTELPLRFVNFAALNHHSTYCGFTSALKNYLGITDLSGGPDPYHNGRLTEDYYNFHSFPFDKWSPGPKPGMLGTEVGVFLKSIRKADINITTAEWIGLCSRTEAPVGHTRAILACVDPVALDYHATKYILYPNSKLAIHDPDNKNSPAHQYLTECSKNVGILDEQYVGVKSYDFSSNSLQKDDDLVILGKKKWGSNIKQLMKYFILKYNLYK